MIRIQYQESGLGELALNHFYNLMRNKFLNTLFFLPIWILGQNANIYAEKIQQYKSWPNPINISIENENDCSDFYVTVDNGKIENNDCSYSVTPENAGRVIVSVYRNDGQLIDSKVFLAEEPVFDAYVLGMPGLGNDIQNVNSFSHSPGLGIMHKDISCWDWDIKNLHYDLMIVKADNQIFRFKSDTNSFSTEMKKEFEKLKSGDILIFRNIRLNEFQVKDLIFEVQ